MIRSFGANCSNSFEKCGESQVVIRASAVVNLRFSPGVRVLAPSRLQRNRHDNRFCCSAQKKDANKSSPAQTISCGRGMPHSLASFCDSFRLVSINFSFFAEHSIRAGRSAIEMSRVNSVDYVVIAVYALLMVLVGLY